MKLSELKEAVDLSANVTRDSNGRFWLADSTQDGLPTAQPGQRILFKYQGQMFDGTVLDKGNPAQHVYGIRIEASGVPGDETGNIDASVAR